MVVEKEEKEEREEETEETEWEKANLCWSMNMIHHCTH